MPSIDTTSVSEHPERNTPGTPGSRPKAEAGFQPDRRWAGAKLCPRPGGCCVIAEVAQAHDGSLGLAHAYVDVAASAGADVIKFQTHLAAAESTPAEPWRVRFSRQDASRYDYWRRMEFSEDQWAGLRAHAEERGLKFLSSPFSVEAAVLLTRIGVAAWKIPSGELENGVLLEAVLNTGWPVILSTGMSSTGAVREAVAAVRATAAPLAVLQCTSAYPCPPEQLGLNLLSEYRAAFDCAVGLSDHSGTIFPGLAAVTLGAELLEVHLTLSREMPGPDVSSSVTSAELRQLVDGVHFLERARCHPVEKDAMAEQLTPMRQMFMKSVVARTDLPEGTILERTHLALKKPGTGLPPSALSRLLGGRLRRAVAADELLRADDIGPGI